MSRPIKIGIQIPVVESTLGIAPRWRDILDLVRHAEKRGFDSAWVPDHLLFRRPAQGGQSQGVWECWSLVAALTAATDRIAIGTLVSCTAFREPHVLANLASTIAAIGGNRLILGLGAGWHEPEFRAFGYPFDRRVSRFEEALEIMTANLRSHPHLNPGKIPIMIGSTGDRMLRLAARHADLWNVGLVSGSNWPDALPPILARLDAACVAVGRDPATLGRTVNLLVTLPLPGMTAVPPEDSPVQGSPEEIAAAFLGFAELGITHLQLLLNPISIEALNALAEVLALLDGDTSLKA